MSELVLKLSQNNDNFWMLPIYLSALILSPIIHNFITVPLTCQIVTTVRSKFIRDNIERYNRLSFDSKLTRPYASFEQVLNPADNALVCLIDWGIPNIVSLCSSICGVVWTFHQKKIIGYFLSLVCVGVSIYHVVVKKNQDKYTQIHKKYRKIRHGYHAKLQLNGISFQYKEVSPDFMFELYSKLLENDQVINSTWNKVSGSTNVLTQVTAGIMIWFCCTNPKDFMLLAFVLQQLTSAVANANCFFTQYNRLQNDFENYCEFWKDSDESPEPEKMYIESRDQIEIKCVEIKRDNYLIRLNSAFTDFKLWPGIKILIEGPYGHGKSSFVKALFGLVESSHVELSYGEGKNFYHQVADYFQEIKGVMPISKVTIQDIFKGETDFDLIRKYLIDAWGEEGHQRIINSLLSTDSANSTDSAKSNQQALHPYQIELKNKLSGGQTSQMLLWQRGWEADRGKSIIVLDEPIPDVDFINYISSLKNFYSKYSDKMIIMIGHLCECKRIALNAQEFFDLELWVENGIINKQR